MDSPMSDWSGQNSMCLTAERRRRSMEKCDDCRAKKIKCTRPPGRGWPEHKCNPCSESGLRCGPDVAARNSTFKRKNRASSIIGMNQEGRELRRGQNHIDAPADDAAIPSEQPNTNENESHLKENTFSGSVMTCIPATNLNDANTIKESFIHIGLFQKALEYLHPVIRNTKSIAPGSPQHTSLKKIVWLVEEKRDSLISDIITSALKLNDQSAEALLLRALKTLEDIEKQRERREENRNVNQPWLRKMIFKRLYKIYIGSGDVFEAEIWLRQLAMLEASSESKNSVKISEKLADSFQHTSKYYTMLLETLELNRQDTSDLWFDEGQALIPAIHFALNGGHAKTASILAKTADNVRQIDIVGQTPFHVAAWKGITEFIQSPDGLEELDMPDMYNFTPLASACFHGHDDTAKALLENGADGHFKASDGRTILSIASKTSHAEIVRLLLQSEDFSMDEVADALLNASSENKLLLANQARQRNNIPDRIDIRLNVSNALSENESEDLYLDVGDSTTTSYDSSGISHDLSQTSQCPYTDSYPILMASRDMKAQDLDLTFCGFTEVLSSTPTACFNDTIGFPPGASLLPDLEFKYPSPGESLTSDFLQFGIAPLQVGEDVRNNWVDDFPTLN